MSQNQINVLFLPKWYPNKLDPFDGNFIENYAHAIKGYCKLTVLFVHSDASLQQAYEINDTDNSGVRELKVYFKKPQHKIKLLNKLITVMRYRNAQKLGYRQLTETKFDLCHVHVLTRSAWLALHLKKRHNIPFVISEHWSGYHKRLGKYKGFLKKWFTKVVVKKSSAIHAVSTPLMKSMQDHGLTGNYTIIPNVVDTSTFQVKEKKNVDTEVIYVGNLLQEPKKILDIIKIFAEVIEEHPTTLLSIYGEGKEEEDCRELIQQLDLGQHVFLRGVRDREGIAEAMAESDFLILFSEYENQPCVINEAQACGIPVVVPSIAGISELMNDELGLSFPTNDKSAFKAAMIEMIQTHANYNALSIRKFASERFSEDEIGKSFLNFYQKALILESK